MKYIFPIALIGMFPLLSSAATYHYVDQSGVVRDVEAPNAQTAIMIAPDRDPHSGVAIDEGDIEPGMEVASVAGSDAGGSNGNGSDNGSLNGTGGPNTWHYVTDAGLTATVEAPSPEVALMRATNIDPHSGVAIDEGMIEDGEFVPAAAHN
ncbi:MAG TPA: hypothetical protein VFS75_03610 [Candidatus Paceibacterota bacterium]|nr:hypothetical protein [Candidatus Paceibacterota bacterium]